MSERAERGGRGGSFTTSTNPHKSFRRRLTIDTTFPGIDSEVTPSFHHIWGYLDDGTVDTFTYEFVNEAVPLTKTIHFMKFNSDLTLRYDSDDFLVDQTFLFDSHDSGSMLHHIDCNEWGEGDEREDSCSPWSMVDNEEAKQQHR